MPHVDEFFAPATLAAAGLAVAIAFQPAARHAANDPAAPAVTASAAPVASARVVRLPTVEVVARRSDAVALAAHERPARPGAKPAA
jgi:hypothetical protein